MRHVIDLSVTCQLIERIGSAKALFVAARGGQGHERQDAGGTSRGRVPEDNTEAMRPHHPHGACDLPPFFSCQGLRMPGAVRSCAARLGTASDGSAAGARGRMGNALENECKTLAGVAGGFAVGEQRKHGLCRE